MRNFQPIALGPSPPGINYFTSEWEVSEFWGNTYHADVVSVQQDLRELRLTTGVIAVFISTMPLLLDSDGIQFSNILKHHIYSHISKVHS